MRPPPRNDFRTTIEEIRNPGPAGTTSGPLKLSWVATVLPFLEASSGYGLADYPLGRLNGGSSLVNVDTGYIPYTPPPSGTYFLTLALIEFDGTGDVLQDFFTFNQFQTFPISATTCTWSVDGSEGLCLNNSRFRVTASWQSTTGSGIGHPVSMTSDTGYVWFFSPNNVEVVMKAVNGCSFNSKYWVFESGLTNVDVTTQVTDTVTGIVKSYHNPLNKPFEIILDTAAFDCR